MNEKPMLVQKSFHVNAYDIDVMGIVSNIVYIRWFEDLRFLLMDHFWNYQSMLKTGQSPILYETSAKYKRPVTIFDAPEGRLWVSSLTKSRWTVDIEISVEEKPVCCGRQTGYFYDLAKKRPVRIPTALLESWRNERGGGP